MLTVLDSIPSGLLERGAGDLHEVLPGPSLLHLEGERPQPLFVSVLLHGNEITGWEAARMLLERYRDRTLPRAVSLFVGNVAAARTGLRHLDEQPDFNRVWGEGSTPEHQMAEQILREMQRRRVFASVDVHNNSGRNPHYACVTRLSGPFLHLATLFGRLVVYFRQPDTVITRAFADMCPAVTVECGRPGQRYGVEHALEFLDACLHLEHLPEKLPPVQDIDLYHSVARVMVPEDLSFGVNDGADVSLCEDLDRLNFQELPEGTMFAQVNPRSNARLEVWNESGEEVGAHYFSVRDEEIVNAVPVIPSMLTLDERVIRQDCLCYLMEKYEVPEVGEK